MKYFQRANIYKNYNGSNRFNPETEEAYSYDWWLYFAKINGQYVFNDYGYSNTTRKHQSHLRVLLHELGYELELFWEVECPDGLQNLDSGIKFYKDKIALLESEIAKPRTQKKKNEERRQRIHFYENKIEMLNKLKGNK